jgi:hypothetical protein
MIHDFVCAVHGRYLGHGAAITFWTPTNETGLQTFSLVFNPQHNSWFCALATCEVSTVHEMGTNDH